MGLITEEVEVGLYHNNIEHYEKLGYEIPRIKTSSGMHIRHGTKILVKVDDLLPYSKVHVQVRCDYCGKIHETTYSQYNLHNHQGKTYCHACAIKVLSAGENHYRWENNKTNEERITKRQYPEYVDFTKRVLIRDKYSCKCCGATNCKLSVHHLDSYDWCIEKRLDDSNGITLCENCHKNFHSLCGYGNNTREQFEIWLGQTISLLDNYDGNLPTARQVYDIDEKKIYKSAKEFCDIHQADITTVYRCCNHDVRTVKHINQDGEISCRQSRASMVKGHHLLWYDEYLQMSPNDLDKYLRQYVNKSLIKVVCATTGKIFNSIADASVYYNTERTGITRCCKGQRHTFGMLNGIPLKWMYLSDFEKLSKEEQEKLLNKKDGEIDDKIFESEQLCS